MRFILIFSYFLFSITSHSVNAFSQEKIIFSLDVIRHGDRTPTIALPKKPYTWPEGIGQLTAEGMRQEYELGVRLRKEYITQKNLLPVSYQAETIYVESTDFDRTLMSAQSLLMGLYPLGTGPKSALPESYQPIPVHTKPLKQETVLIPDLDKQRFDELLKKYVFTRSDWLEKTVALQPHFKQWSEATGLTITNLEQLMVLGDLLSIFQAHHISFPDGISEEDADKIMAVAKWTSAARFKPVEIGNATGRVILKMIADYLSKASQQKTKIKYVLLSAHDSTIMTTMSALHASLEESPRYASRLNFSLFESSPGDYIVKISFNDQPVLIPACGNTTCTLTQFITHFATKPSI